MSGKINILHIIDALNHGGAQQLLLLIAKFTPKDKYDVTVCVLQENNEIRPRFETENIKVVSLGKKRCSIFNPSGFLSYIFSVLKEIKDICRKKNIQVIQCHLSDAEFLGIIAGRIYGIDRIITTVHSSSLLPQRSSFSPRNRLRIIVTRILYRFTSSVIAVSSETASNIQKVFRVSSEKICTIPNRIDVGSFKKNSMVSPGDVFPGLAEEHRILCMVGRLMPPKGQAYLLGAVKMLCPEYPGLRLLLVGDGDMRKEFENLSRKLEIQEKVIFLGSRDDIPEILAISEIFVLSSLWEGISLALIEAMAAGKPIVATDIPGNRELIRHGENGLLVTKEDSEALAYALKGLLDNPSRARRLGDKAYQEAKARFDISLTIRELEKIWDNERTGCL